MLQWNLHSSSKHFEVLGLGEWYFAPCHGRTTQEFFSGGGGRKILETKPAGFMGFSSPSAGDENLFKILVPLQWYTLMHSRSLGNLGTNQLRGAPAQGVRGKCLWLLNRSEKSHWNTTKNLGGHLENCLKVDDPVKKVRLVYILIARVNVSLSVRLNFWLKCCKKWV